MLISTVNSMLTPGERFLAKNQKKLALDSATPSNTESDNADFNPIDPDLNTNKHALKLAEGVKLKQKDLEPSKPNTL